MLNKQSKLNEKLLDELERLFPKGDKSRGKALVFNSFANMEIEKEKQLSEKKIIKIIKKDRPMFIKNNYVDLIRWHLTEKEIITVRTVLRIEILEELGVNCTEMRTKLSKNINHE